MKKQIMKKWFFRLSAILLLTVFICVLLAGCTDKPKDKGNPKDIGPYASLWEYAQSLEEAGNSEAAAAVYALIAKGADGELIKDLYGENSNISEWNELEQARDIFDAMKGGTTR